MQEKTHAKIISYNLNHIEISASAARISTTQGNAIEIFEKAKGHAKNHELIKKVLASGHKSVIEHIVFTIAFCDVSAFVEQFFIECRLASFTVKSRRYVDFSNLGYYIPPDLKGEELAQYRQYMDMLFTAYQTLLEDGIPKEDARFILPYSFHSNFYCTVNARELALIISAIRYGRGKNFPELQILADQITTQIDAVFPELFSDPENMSDESTAAAVLNDTVHVQDTLTLITSQEAGTVSMLNGPSDPLKILETAYYIHHPGSGGTFDPNMLLHSKRPRELEQLSYTFLISNITLSGITHIVRHRMQSIVIPCIQSVNHSNCIIPDSIKKKEHTAEFYTHTLEQANTAAGQMSRNPILKQYSYYYALSGNTMHIMTTINARELNHFIHLRTCNRAQWEIRKISIEMLKQLRISCPPLFHHFGPSCYADGICPEGNLTCHKMNQTIEQFTHLT